MQLSIVQLKPSTPPSLQLSSKLHQVARLINTDVRRRNAFLETARAAYVGVVGILQH